MPSQIESIPPFGFALGLAFALFALALFEFGYHQPSTTALVATVLLAVVLALQGLRPFGDTVAYYLLQAATFAFWGITMIAIDEPTVISAVFAVVGLISVLDCGRRTVREGVWSTTDS